MAIRKVVVGVSGGVDSAVSALLLKSKGFEVLAAFMKNWDQTDESGQCSVDADLADAQWICSKLNIPLIEVKFVKQYWNEVFSNFLQDYETGLTPNPDILCNRHVKFTAFYQYARQQLKADAIATGHYAQSSFGSFLEHYQPNASVKLKPATDSFKDQTFFLSHVHQEALQRTMFPVGNLLKQHVKEIAATNHLDRIATKRESTGICFIGKRHFQDFIQEYITNKPGDFISFDTGEVLGQHEGLHHWTVGQRCRLSGHLKPHFVLQKNNDSNSITVVAGTHHASLFTDVVYTGVPHWIGGTPFHDNATVECKFRFQHTKPLTDCTIVKASSGLMVFLKKPLRAITPGQYAVFYTDDECLGGARILGPGILL